MSRRCWAYYGVPLILTSDDGVTTLMTDDEVVPR